MARTVTNPILEPLVLKGRAGRRDVRFPNRMLLAPMEGVTDPDFRGLVLDLGGAGGASTEFVRVSSHVVKRRVIADHLGPPRADVPVAVQLMAAGTDYLAETIAQAEAAGARWIDLNFGCPVKRVCGRGAGSALLDDPETLGRIVVAAVESTDLPVSAKVRLGVRDTSRFDEVLDATGAAAMLTVHARTRAESYAMPARWEWIAHAVERTRERHPGTLVIGNGAIDYADDAHRMQRETGCDGVMVGRAAIADPFLFNEAAGEAAVGREEAVRFAVAYLDALAGPRRFGRFKQLLRVYRAGGLFAGREEQRLHLLRCTDAAEVRASLLRFE